MTPIPPGRRTRDELRALVTEAAIDLVRVEGLGAVSTTLTYQKVFDHLEATKGVRVTRASVHERIWNSQEEFQNHVLLSRRPWANPEAASTTGPALDVFDRTQGMSPIERMREMTRVAAARAQEISESDPLYYSWVGITMCLAKDARLDADDEQRLRLAVGEAYAEMTGRNTRILETLGAALGVRPRVDLFRRREEGWAAVVRLGTALSEGVSVRTRMDPDELPPVMLATGPDGELQEWTMFAAGYWALLATFLEVDPDAQT